MAVKANLGGKLQLTDVLRPDTDLDVANKAYVDEMAGSNLTAGYGIDSDALDSDSEIAVDTEVIASRQWVQERIGHGYHNYFPDSDYVMRKPTTHDSGNNVFASNGNDIVWFGTSQSAFDTEVAAGETIRVTLRNTSDPFSEDRVGFYTVTVFTYNMLDDLYSMELQHITGHDPLAENPNDSDSNHQYFIYISEQGLGSVPFDGYHSGFVVAPDSGSRNDTHFLDGTGKFTQVLTEIDSDDFIEGTPNVSITDSDGKVKISVSGENADYLTRDQIWNTYGPDHEAQVDFQNIHEDGGLNVWNYAPDISGVNSTANSGLLGTPLSDNISNVYVHYDNVDLTQVANMAHGTYIAISLFSAADTPVLLGQGFYRIRQSFGRVAAPFNGVYAMQIYSEELRGDDIYSLIADLEDYKFIIEAAQDVNLFQSLGGGYVEAATNFDLVGKFAPVAFNITSGGDSIFDRAPILTGIGDTEYFTSNPTEGDGHAVRNFYLGKGLVTEDIAQTMKSFKFVDMSEDAEDTEIRTYQVLDVFESENHYTFRVPVIPIESNSDLLGETPAKIKVEGIYNQIEFNRVTAQQLVEKLAPYSVTLTGSGEDDLWEFNNDIDNLTDSEYSYIGDFNGARNVYFARPGRISDHILANLKYLRARFTEGTDTEFRTYAVTGAGAFPGDNNVTINVSREPLEDLVDVFTTTAELEIEGIYTDTADFISGGSKGRDVLVESATGDTSPLTVIKHNSDNTVDINTVDSEYAGDTDSEHIASVQYGQSGSLDLIINNSTSAPPPFDTDGTIVYVVTDTYTFTISGKPNVSGALGTNRTVHRYNSPVHISGSTSDYNEKYFAKHQLLSVHVGKLGFTMADTDWIKANTSDIYYVAGDGLDLEDDSEFNVRTGDGISLVNNDVSVNFGEVASRNWVQSQIANASIPQNPDSDRTSMSEIFRLATEDQTFSILQDAGNTSNRTKIANTRGSTLYQVIAMNSDDFRVNGDPLTGSEDWTVVPHNVYEGNNTSGEVLYATNVLQYNGLNNSEITFDTSENFNITFTRNGGGSSSLFEVTGRLELVVADDPVHFNGTSNVTRVGISNEWNVDLPTAGNVRNVISGVRWQEPDVHYIKPGQYMAWRMDVHVDHFDQNGITFDNAPYLTWSGYPGTTTNNHAATIKHVERLAYGLYVTTDGDINYENHQVFPTIDQRVLDSEDGQPVFFKANSGNSATLGGTSSISIGGSSHASHNQAIALGYLAQTDTDNQLMIGATGDSGISNIKSPQFAPSSGLHYITVDTDGNWSFADASSNAYIVTNYDGGGASASGTDNMAIGESATATGQNGVAVGRQARATNSNATAYGTNARAEGNSSVALGGGPGVTQGAQAYAASSIAIGRDATVPSAYLHGIAMGEGATVSQERQMRIGRINEVVVDTSYTPDSDYSLATKKYVDGLTNPELEGVHAFGAKGTGDSDAQAGGLDALAYGWNTNAAGTGSIAIGLSAKSTVNDALAIGRLTDATGTRSIAIGGGPTGFGAEASAEEAIAIGASSTASGLESVSLGNQANSTGEHAISIGFNASASDTDALAIGAGSDAMNTGAIAVGNGAESFTENSIAIGDNATAGSATSTNNEMIAIGHNATTTGFRSVALGTDSSATGSNSVSVGREATAANLDSVALGRGSTTTANGQASFAGGNITHIKFPTVTGLTALTALGNTLGSDDFGAVVVFRINDSDDSPDFRIWNGSSWHPVD